MRYKPLHIIFSVLLTVLLAFAFLASAGSLTPSAYPTSTMNTLEEIYNSVASTFDSSGLTANANGSVLGMLKYVNNNLFWASSSGNVYNLNSGSIAIGTSTFPAKLTIQGAGNGTTTSAFSVLNSSGTSLFHITDEGKVLMGTTTELIGSVNGQFYLYRDQNADMVIGNSATSSSYSALRFVGSAPSGSGAYIQAGSGVTSTPANLYITRFSSAEASIDLFHVKSNKSVFSNLLSIGTTSSSSQLTIQSAGNSTSTNALTVLNSVGSSLFNINDAGGIDIGTSTYQGGVINAYAQLNLFATSSGAVIRLNAGEAGGHLYRILSTGVGSDVGAGYFVIDKYASSTSAHTIPFRIDLNENVGIGDGVTMDARLSIKSLGNTSTTNALSISNSDASSVFSINDEGTFLVSGTSRGMSITSSNGIYSDLISRDNGTTSLAIFRAYNNTNRVASLGIFGSNSGWDGYYGVYNNEAFLMADSTGTPIVLTTADSPIRFSPGTVEHMRIATSGYVGIGTTTPARTLHVVGGGAICSSIDASCPTTETAGDLYATTRSGGAIDVAEWIKASSSDIPQPGEIVVAAGNGAVTRSSQSYQKGIVGVVSTQPHLTMGSEYAGEDAIKLALTGRVPVKVSLENGHIFAGDTLTSSSEPGKAMKAKQEGPTIGIALQDYLSESQGDSILVLISLGYHTLDIDSSGQVGEWLIGSDGKLTATTDVDLGGHSITNVKSILSSSGSWSIDEGGKMVIQEIVVKDKMRLIDKDTGEEFCSFVKGGAMVLEQCQ